MRRKIAAQFIVSNISTLANFALTIILARILSPADVGIFSMSAVLIGVAHVFRDFGVTAYLKQEQYLSEKILSGAIGLLFICSVMAFCATYLSASLWGRFYNEPQVESVIRVLAVGFLLIPFGAIPQAILMREMDVKNSAWVTGVSTVIYFCASLGLALAGAKHMTMAWANLINIVFSGIAFNFVSSRKIRWVPSIHGWKKILGFGSGNLVSALIRTADAALPDILLGRLSSATNVGLFSRANSTVNIIGTVIHPTIYFFAVPYLAKTHHVRGSLANEYLRSSSLVNCLMLPALIWIAIAAHETVSILYGPQWLISAEIIPWLSLMCGAGSVFLMAGYAVTGIGKPHAVIAPLVIALLAKIAFVLWLFDGALVSFVMAIALGQIVAIPFYVWSLVHYLGVDPRKWLFTTLKPSIVWIPAALAYYAFHHYIMSGWLDVFKVMVGGIFYVLLLFVGYLLIDVPLRDEIRQILVFSRRAFREVK